MGDHKLSESPNGGPPRNKKLLSELLALTSTTWPLESPPVSDTKCEPFTRISQSTRLLKKTATESKSETSSEKKSTEKSKCCQASKSPSAQNKKTNSGSKVMTSKTSAEVAPWFTTKLSSEIRISESSWMVSTFPRKPKSSRTTNFSDSKFMNLSFVSVKS